MKSPQLSLWPLPLCRCRWSARGASRSLANVERFTAGIVGNEHPRCAGSFVKDRGGPVPAEVVVFDGEVGIASRLTHPRDAHPVALCLHALVIKKAIALYDDAGHGGSSRGKVKLNRADFPTLARTGVLYRV